ncbi:hypothetical protein OROGR_014939 [Orobanche gracilis]
MAEEGYSYESRFACNMSDKKTSTFDDFGDGQQQPSYVLRENPKKTWRAVVDHPMIPSPHDKICKQCGKGFQSMKALCGHMACHSDRDRNVKDDGSWTSESRKAAVGDSCSDTEEGEERRMRTRSSSSSKYKRYKKFVEKSPCFTLSSNNTNNINGLSYVSEIDGQDQEDVAMCLMLLSRDFGNNNNNNRNSVVESSDNNSVVLETKSSSIEMRIGKVEKLNDIHKLYEKKIGNMKLKGKILGGKTTQVGDFDSDSDSGYFLGECAKADSDLSVDGFRRFKNEDYGVGFEKSLKVIKNELRKKMSKGDVCGDTNGTASDFAVIESRERKYYISDDPDEFRDSSRKKKSKYECYNCKRTFKSYQALGGHRPCHKRTSAFYEPAYEFGENSLDESADYDKKKPSGKKIKASKNKGHVCPFCDRVFKNGQALGGHKRSHFIGSGRVENYNQSRVIKMAGRDLLDLNLPAPEDDDDNGRGKFDF